jgi:predicted nucleic acid-binding protein
MKPRVYIETTIPSFYHSVRTEPDMIARRDWTRRWWDDHRQEFELFTSEAVIEELEQGGYPNRDDCLELARSIPILPIEDEITEIVQVYIDRRVMPANPFGDALHLAMASYHHCDVLLTWNCRHLANANKYTHIRRVNVMLDLFVPTLATPLEFLGEEDTP